jgi:hypothetical protein
MARDDRQTVAIHRNRRNGEFRIQPYARLGGGSQPCGAPVALQRNVSDEDLLRAVLDNLAKNDQQKYDLALVPIYSPEERRRMLKEDQVIHIERSQEQYRLIPLKRMRSSFGSIDDMATSAAASDFCGRGGQMIRQVFQKIP